MPEIEIKNLVFESCKLRRKDKLAYNRATIVLRTSRWYRRDAAVPSYRVCCACAARGNPRNQCINNRLPMRPKTRKPALVVRYFRKVFPRPSDATSAHPIYKRLCINSLKVNTTTHVTNINSEKPLLIIDRLTLLPKIIV